MEYYIISFFISIVIFSIVYLYDYKSQPINYNDDLDNDIIDNKTLFNSNNLLLFFIIYIVITIISYYNFTASLSISSFLPLFLTNLLKTPEPAPPLIKDNCDDIDPTILNKITDNIDIGFIPPE